MVKEIPPEEYLKKDFDYSKLTKNQLRKIMHENGVEEIPALTAKKSELLDAYKSSIHNRIDVLRRRGSISSENPFQKSKKKVSNIFENVPSPANRTQDKKMNENDFPARSTAHEDEHIDPIPYKKEKNEAVFPASYSEIKKKASASDPTLNKIGSEASSNSTASTSMLVRVIYTLIIPVMCVMIYIKLLCPYCGGDEFFCILPPEHSKVVDGKLVCDDSFVIKRGIFKTCCVRDDRREKEIGMEVKQIKRMLERKNGDFLYGMTSNRAMPLESLSKDPEVIKKLVKETGIITTGDMVYSVNRRISAKTFVKYYARRILMGTIPLILTLIAIKTFQSYTRKRYERLLAARKMVKDVNDVLVRQIYVSAKNSNFPSYIYVEQLKDCFGVDKSIWNEVEKIVLKNSNVHEIKIADKKAWEWVGPILYKPEFNGSLL